jgi:type IV secretory pathway VirB3-like protein
MVCCLWFVVYGLLSMVCCLWFVVYVLLSMVWLFFIVYYLLLVWALGLMNDEGGMRNEE